MSDPLLPEDNEELDRLKARLMERRLQDKSKSAPAITFRDEKVGVVQGGAADNYDKDPFKKVVVEVNGEPQDTYLQHQIQDGLKSFDPARLEELDRLKPTPNSVNVIDGKWYEVDDKGETWTIDDGEKGAMDFMREGHKPGLGVMSARRIALQRAKNKEEPVNMRLYDLPEIKMSGRLDNFAARVLEDENPNEPEPTPEDEEVSGPMRSKFTSR